MILNITIESIVGLISLFLKLVSLLLVTDVYIFDKHRNIFMKVFLSAWLFFTIYYATIALSYLFLNYYLFMSSYYIVVVVFLLISIAYDLMRYDKIRTIPFAVYTALLGYFLSLLIKHDFITDYYYPNGDKSFISFGLTRLIFPFVVLYPTSVLLINTYKIYKQSSEGMKKIAMINLIGASLFTIGPIILFIFKLYIFPGIDVLLPALGLLIVSISVNKYPQLLYVLSFRLYHLTVIQRNTGLILYHHSWKSEFRLNMANQQMYSSMLEALSGFSFSTLNSGRLKHLSLEYGELILSYRKDYNFYFALFASNRTRLLTDSLEKFENNFIEKFGSQLSEEENYVMTSINDEGDKLVNNIFNYTLTD